MKSCLQSCLHKLSEAKHQLVPLRTSSPTAPTAFSRVHDHIRQFRNRQHCLLELMSSPYTFVDADSPIRVVVAPAQSAYFAGEPFQVTITFTNTRSPGAPSAPTGRVTPRSANGSFTHKRAAHSISSAPMARPPTSPGTPAMRAASSSWGVSAMTNGTVDLGSVRRGLVGKSKKKEDGRGEEKDAESAGKKRLAGKSLSVDLDIRNAVHSDEPDLRKIAAANTSEFCYLYRTRHTRLTVFFSTVISICILAPRTVSTPFCANTSTRTQRIRNACKRVYASHSL